MRVLFLFLLAGCLTTSCTKLKDREKVKPDLLATMDEEDEFYNIFTTQTPAVSGTDGPYELGTKFKATQLGQITQIRYYKTSGETGTHTGRIWSAAGTVLASVTFTGETASGWQTATLSTPYETTVNTVYVVTVNSNTEYGATSNGLENVVTNGPLSTIVGANGVFGTTLGAFPTGTYHSTNYFRDVTFEVLPDISAPTTPDSVTVTENYAYGLDLSWKPSTDNVIVTGYNVYNDTVLLASVYGTWANIYGLTPSTPYSIKVRARDAAGNLSVASTAINITSGSTSSGLRGWQIDSTNAGLTGKGIDKGTLPLYTGGRIPRGSTISMKKIVDLDVSEGNIIIDRCWIVSTASNGWPVGSTEGAVLIKDSHIEGSGGLGSYAAHPQQTPLDKDVTFLRVVVSIQGGGFSFGGASIVRNCLINNLPGNGEDPGTTGNHVDGGTRRIGTAQLNVIDNHIDVRSAGNNATGAFMIQPTYGFIDNILLRGNLFGGGGYVISAGNYTPEGGPTRYYGDHIYIDNNRFYSGPAYGYISTQGAALGGWTNNYVNNSANTDNKGTVITYP